MLVAAFGCTQRSSARKCKVSTPILFACASAAMIQINTLPAAHADAWMVSACCSLHMSDLVQLPRRGVGNSRRCGGQPPGIDGAGTLRRDCIAAMVRSSQQVERERLPTSIAAQAGGRLHNSQYGVCATCIAPMQVRGTGAPSMHLSTTKEAILLSLRTC